MTTKNAKAKISIEVFMEDGTVDCESYEADVAHLNELYKEVGRLVCHRSIADLIGALESVLDRVDPLKES